jgi:hypothetical protein
MQKGEKMDGNNQNGQYGNYQDYTSNVPYQSPVNDGGGNKTNGLQIAGLVCGILAICTSCCYGVPGIILGVAGLICAIIGNNRGKTGVGTAGLVCSIIGIIFGVIGLIYYIWAINYLNEIGYFDMIFQ